LIIGLITCRKSNRWWIWHPWEQNFYKLWKISEDY